MRLRTQIPDEPKFILSKTYKCPADEGKNNNPGYIVQRIRDYLRVGDCDDAIGFNLTITGVERKEYLIREYYEAWYIDDAVKGHSPDPLQKGYSDVWLVAPFGDMDRGIFKRQANVRFYCKNKTGNLGQAGMLGDESTGFKVITDEECARLAKKLGKSPGEICPAGELPFKPITPGDGKKPDFWGTFALPDGHSLKTVWDCCPCKKHSVGMVLYPVNPEFKKPNPGEECDTQPK